MAKRRPPARSRRRRFLHYVRRHRERISLLMLTSKGHLMTSPLPPLVRELATEALLLALSLGEAESIQWSPSLTPKPREDTTERASGGHGDPTLATVVDERRLAVRAQVDAGTAHLEEAVSALRRARANVDEAVNSWNGS